MDNKCYVVCDNSTGIPYRNQDYMTYGECIEWIKHDVEECHKCGLDSITAEDYEIKDMSKYMQEEN